MWTRKVWEEETPAYTTFDPHFETYFQGIVRLLLLAAPLRLFLPPQGDGQAAVRKAEDLHSHSGKKKPFHYYYYWCAAVRWCSARYRWLGPPRSGAVCSAPERPWERAETRWKMPPPRSSAHSWWWWRGHLFPMTARRREKMGPPPHPWHNGTSTAHEAPPPDHSTRRGR